MCRQGKKKALRSFRVGTRVLFLIAVSSLCLAACAPTFSPPVRTAILGVPGRQAPNEIMAGLSVVSVLPAVGAMLTPYFSVPVTRNLFVEAGASTSKFFTMGYLGGKISKRLRPANSGWGQDGLFGTLSFGGGVGRGGERHRQATVADPYRYLSETVVKPFESLAGGLYLDAGLGYFPLSWFGLGLGARLQGTKAQNIPATLWHQYLASVELFVDIFSVYVSSGLAFYYNREDWNSGLVMEGGLTARLPFGDSLRAPTEWKKIFSTEDGSALIRLDSSSVYYPDAMKIVPKGLARQLCKGRGGRLLVPTEMTQIREQLLQLYGNPKWIWTQDGVYQFSSGEEMSYTQGKALVICRVFEGGRVGLP